MTNYDYNRALWNEAADRCMRKQAGLKEDALKFVQENPELVGALGGGALGAGAGALTGDDAKSRLLRALIGGVGGAGLGAGAGAGARALADLLQDAPAEAPAPKTKTQEFMNTMGNAAGNAGAYAARLLVHPRQ